MFCPKCGNQAADDSGFCGECGAPLGASRTLQVAQTPQPPTTIQQPYGYPVAPMPQRSSRKTARIVALGAGAAVIIAAIVVVYNLFFAPYAIDEERFPDASLRAIITMQLDPDHDGLITRDEAEAVQFLEIDGASSITGLDIFPNLHQLTLKGDALASANLEGCSALQVLNAPGCTHLSSIALGNMPALNTLDLSDCAVVDLDLTGAPELTSANLSGDPIGSLDLVNNTKLAQLECDDSVMLTNLDSTPLHEYWVVETFSSGPGPAAMQNDVLATYDARGNLVKLVHKNGQYGVETCEYEYDDLDRCILSRSSFVHRIGGSQGDSTTTLSYDEAGRLVKTATDNGSTQMIKSITYNDQGLPLSYQQGDYGYNFSYDSNGDLSSVAPRSGSGETSRIKNNDKGLMISAEVVSNLYNESSSFAIEYDSAGRLTKYSANTNESYVQTMEYDPEGRLINATRKFSRPADYVFAKYSEADISSAKFEYDEHGLLASVTPAKSGNGVASEYEIGYTRILTTRSTSPNCNFLNLADPLAPEVNVDFWDLGSYIYTSNLFWHGSMENIMKQLAPSAA